MVQHQKVSKYYETDCWCGTLVETHNFRVSCDSPETLQKLRFYKISAPGNYEKLRYLTQSYLGKMVSHLVLSYHTISKKVLSYFQQMHAHHINKAISLFRRKHNRKWEQLKNYLKLRKRGTEIYNKTQVKTIIKHKMGIS